jgi:pimeloyl-ACP methyl ester carboxylesterase
VESTVRVGDDQIWLADDGAGPPVVLLHPGVGDSRVWNPVLPLLAGYRVIRYDCRGYGRSPASSEQYTQSGDLVAVLDRLGLARATFAGCSMGGGTAAALAVTDPARVDGLVLACPGIPGHPMPPDPEMAAQGTAAEQSGDLEELIRYALAEWAGSGPDETVDGLMRNAVRAWVTEDGHELPDAPVFDRLDEIATPTVLLVGDRDRPALIEANKAAADRIPRCRLDWLPGVDHYLPLRAPHAVADAIREVRPAT